MTRILNSLSPSCIGVCLLFTAITANAQITPDGTIPTQVNSSGNTLEITGGATAGTNLFHSFKEFSLPTGGEAFFNNSVKIDNIINRVTGGSISNIDGLIRANGSANLFLINPAGIVFGENARLNIGGSFLGSTADGLLFEDGTEFSATDPKNQPILTINAPIGLNFRDNPGNVELKGAVLEVNLGQNLTLVGGNLSIDGGSLTASEGRVELGGLATEGGIGINSDGSLDFPDNLARGNVSLTNQAFVNVSGSKGGSIGIKANNFEILSGSVLLAGIAPDSSNSTAQAGDITIKAKDAVTIGQSSFIANTVEQNAQGNAGNIDIQAGSLFLDGSVISSGTNGQGNGGDILLQIDKEVKLTDLSLITSRVEPGGVGSAGDINIQANSLSIIDGAQIIAEVTRSVNNLPGGRGQGGNIEIDAADFVFISGVGTDGFSSGLIANTDRGASGSAGNIFINTNSFVIADGAVLESLTRNNSNGGNITVNAKTFEATDGGQIITTTFDSGDAGNINLNVSDRVTISGSDPNFDRRLATFGDEVVANQGAASGLFTNGTPDSTGSGGNLSIQTGNLTLDDSATLSAATASGQGGNITLTINDILSLDDNSTISAQASNEANGGNIAIDADFVIAFPSQFNGNDILASAEAGEGGNINITAQGIFGIAERPQNPLTNDIDASSQFSLDGTVNLNTPDVESFQETNETPENIVETEKVVAGVCDPAELAQDILNGTENTFVIKGKGGVPPEPTEPFLAETIIIEGKSSPLEVVRQRQDKPSKTQATRSLDRYPPILTSNGAIYPARAIVHTQDGQVWLTANPPTTVAVRTPNRPVNCGKF
jgi:filamentous hemagglutinin family protein